MIEALGILFCLVFTAFFSGIETGVISVNRLRLQHMTEQGVRGARRIRRFLDHPERLLGTTLVGTNLCNVGASVLAASLAARWWPQYGEWISAATMTLVILVLGEMLPKAWFRQAPAARSAQFARLLEVGYRVLWPLVMLSRGLTYLTELIFHAAPAGHPAEVTREDLLHLAYESVREGRISDEEEAMIRGALEACKTRAADVMVPAGRAVTIEPNDPVRIVRRIVSERNVSRLPVVEPRSRRPLGLVIIYDLLFEPEKHRGNLAREVMRDAHVVTAEQTLDRVLASLKEWRQPLASVVDRRGRFLGLVTIEDILEEVVGEIEG